MLNYRGFGYRPDYGYKLYEGDKLLQDKDVVRYAACFSEVFSWFRYKPYDVFKGTYTLRCRKTFEKDSGNYCCLNKKDVLKIVRYMRRIFDIKVDFIDTKDNYIFGFHIEGKPVKHKFILTFSRVFFEFPYNEIAKEALHMRDMGVIDGVDYTHKNFMEVYHRLCMYYQDGWGGGHSLFVYPCSEIKTSTLREAFKKGKSQVQDVYVGEYDLFRKMPKYKKGIYGIDWEKGFEERVQVYSEQFQKIKKIKNEKHIRRRARKAVR